MYKTILLAVDLGETSSWTKALPTAIELSRAFRANLHVVSVLPDFGMSIVGSFFPKDFEKKALAEAEASLHAFVDANIPKDVKATCDIGHGRVYEEILEAAKRIKADLIVMAAHRPENRDFLLGPNAARVARHAECTVMVVRQ